MRPHFYPAVNDLLSRLGSLRSGPEVATIPNPAGIEGDHPDVALYEIGSQVLVLPVEVRGPGHDIEALLESEQALRYARTFGGGKILLTNLHAWVLAQEQSRVMGGSRRPVARPLCFP